MVDSKRAKTIPKHLIATAALLATSLIVCNIAFITSNGWARLCWGVLGYGALFLAYKLAELKLADIGLATSNLTRGLKFGGYIILIILAGLLLVFLLHRGIYKDSRYHHSLAAALSSSLILLPLKTVFFEELAFRGVLLGMLLKFRKGRRFATLASSIAYGLWHISSATKISSPDIGGIVIPQILIVLVVVVVTTLAGILFCELRWRSKSLIAPISVHWFINGFATILAALSWA